MESGKRAEAPQGVHLAGSTPFKSAYEHFSTSGNRLGPYIQSISDGETEPPLRQDWASCLVYAFKQVPWLLRPDLEMLAEKERETLGLDTIPKSDLSVVLENLRIGYDEWAVASYALLKQLKIQSLVPQHLKFQVGLPTLTSVCLFIIKPQYRTMVEPFYQKALARAMRKIQDDIPHDELVIQFETVAEIILLENGWKRENAYGMDPAFITPWFGDSSETVREGIFERLDRVINDQNIDSDVTLGFHICYGDSMHKHFVEPSDSEHIAAIAEHLVSAAGRPVSYIHFPVPKERDDDAYLEPLRAIWARLQASGIYLYVGLVQGDDKEGTRKRIATAKRVFGPEGWGIANECGLCRTPEADFEGSLAMYTTLTNPWRQ